VAERNLKSPPRIEKRRTAGRRHPKRITDRAMGFWAFRARIR
jgi:hypothetical protein